MCIYLMADSAPNRKSQTSSSHGHNMQIWNFHWMSENGSQLLIVTILFCFFLVLLSFFVFVSIVQSRQKAELRTHVNFPKTNVVVYKERSEIRLASGETEKS